MKQLLFMLLIVAVALRVKSQSAGACYRAQNLCYQTVISLEGMIGTGLTNSLSVSNPTINPQTGNGNNPAAAANAGCLLNNGIAPKWLILTVSVSGDLGFIFGAPNSTNPQIGLYDWAMWQYMPGTCDNIFNNTQPPVACNANAVANGGTGMGPVPPGSNPGNFQPSIPVTAGQQYLILLSNTSGVTSPVPFTSTGTASLGCGFSTNICAGETVTISPIGFTSLNNSTFTLQPSGLINSTGSFTIMPMTTTTYTIYGQGTNSLNVPVLQTSIIPIRVNPKPFLAPTVTQITCNNTIASWNLNLSFLPASASPGYTINWSPQPPGVTNATQTSFSGTNPGVGTYFATVIADGGCSNFGSITLNPNAGAANFMLNPAGNSFSVNCYQPNLVISTNASFSYTWTSPTSAAQTGPSASFNSGNLGTWTVNAINPLSGCVASRVFNVGQDFATPTATVSPAFQIITCSITAVTTVSASSTQTINTMHSFYAPGGNVFSAPSNTAIYVPGTPGTYTHCIVNLVSGCSTCQTFTVASSDAYPTLNVTSNKEFTLGCSQHSLNVVTVTGETNPPGGSATFTLLPPGYTGAYGSLNSQTAYSITSPGMWTAVIKNPSPSFCESKVQFSVIQDIAGPFITADVPEQILSCNTPSVILTGQSTSPNVIPGSFAWSFPGTPGTLASQTIAVYTTTNVSSPDIATYTLNVTDIHNLCISTLNVPMRQNIFAPKASISNNASFSITCKDPTVNFINSSSSTIPPNLGFPTNSFVVASLWEGPPPQIPQALTTGYHAFMAGAYVLTAKDLNNGCTSKATAVIGDNRLYPVINTPVPPPFVLDCGALTRTIAPVLSGTNTNYTYEWVAPVTASTGVLNNSFLLVNQPGAYRVLVTNNNNGCKALSEVQVTTGDLTGSFTPSQLSGYAPLNVSFINNSSSSLNTESITSVWSFGNGTQATTSSASITANAIYTQPGTYTVTMFANKGTCQDTAVRIIHVDMPSKIEVPNVFTPNGDGVNDVFFLNVANLTEISSLIFDRWGHKVYELTSTTGNIAWDGTNETGMDVAAGTYFYMIKATGKDGQSYDTKGTVNLYR